MSVDEIQRLKKQISALKHSQIETLNLLNQLSLQLDLATHTNNGELRHQIASEVNGIRNIK